jgi:hypothetical protein
MSQLSSLAAAKARLQAAKAAPSVPTPLAAGGVPPRTPRVSSPSTSLVRGIEGIGELTLSGGGGGGDASSVFVVTLDIMAGICCGAVKGRVRFCTLGGDSCPFKTHAEKKIPVRLWVLYIAGGRNSAHTDPVLAVSSLSSSQLERLLTEQHTVPEWTQLFHVLGSMTPKWT